MTTSGTLGFDHRDVTGRAAAASPIAGHELWLRLFEAATRCAIQYNDRLGHQDPGFEAYAGHRHEIGAIISLRSVNRKLAVGLEKAVSEDNTMPRSYKTVLLP